MKLFIKELRERQNMTQKELADKLQVSFQTISKWENGVNLPDITHIPRLAEIFGVSADVILGLEPVNKNVNLRKFDDVEYWNKNRELTKIWKKLYWNDDYFNFLVRDVWCFNKPVDILDFGCGYGYLGMKLLPLVMEGSSYTGIEADVQQIEEANEYFSQTSYSYEFIQANVYDYEPVKKYDMVVGLFFLSYMRQPEKLIEKMKNSLKPGGMILLMDANYEVEQAGYLSGMEQEENGMKCPDFSPVWEYELSRQERDYKMGTKLPYLFKKCGLKNIQARISDMVQIYEPEDSAKKEMNDIFRYVYENEETFGYGVDYFVNRGISYQKAEEYVEYYRKTKEYFERNTSMAVKTSGMYFVYGYVI